MNTSRPIAPLVRGGNHVLVFGNLSFEVDAAVGARVTAFRIDGENFLIGAEVDAANYGSTFWTSPQTQWTWPPVAELDNLPYQVEPAAAAIVMKSQFSTALGVSVEKRFTVDADAAAVTLEYVIVNRGPAPVRLAPWEVTRVRPHGLTFFPTGEGQYPPSTLVVEEVGGVTWFRYDADQITGHQKLFADVAGGWIAHVDGRAILIKTFPPVPRADQAPGEAVIELYANPEHTYVEVEQQGALLEIAPGGSSSWPVKWYLRRLPEDVDVAVGSRGLVDFVVNLIGRGG